MKVMKHDVKRVLWAFDPFEKEIECDPATVAELGAIFKKLNVMVEPVYVFTPTAGDGFTYSAIAQKIEQLFQRWPVQIATPTILTNVSSSMRKGVLTFAQYAATTKADLVIVTSHGRKGFSRMTFGSFAENLLKITKVPLLFLNRVSRPHNASFHRTLFATDFSHNNKRAFQHFLSLGSKFCSEVLLYHELNFSIEFVTAGMYGAMGVPSPIIGDVIGDQTKWAKTEAKKWLRIADKWGVGAKALFENGYDLSMSILKEAIDQQAGMIVMAAQSGPLESLMVGSHARQVFRAGELPVWIYGPLQFEKNAGIQSKRIAENVEHSIARHV
jgi:nucleotide-binding universal stress UspA family protein